MQIIKNKAVVEDSWVHYSGTGDLPEGNVILSLKDFREMAPQGRKIGVQLEPGDLADDIRDDLDRIDLIAINFPTFMDGRGYSLAKILRDRYGYQKEIRAVGDIMRDQLFYLQRCGFNAYEIKAGRDIMDAVKGLEDFSVTYQVSADEKQPIYRRREISSQ